MIEQVASRLSATADDAAKKLLATELVKTDSPFAKKLLAGLSAAPTAPVVPKNKKFKADPAVHERGLAVYSLTCVACHGPEGKGVPGAFPPLDGSALVLGKPEQAIRIVLHGLTGPVEVPGKLPVNSLMPPSGLADTEIADVLSFVRHAWSNDAAPVSAGEVKRVREETKDRQLPWTLRELR